MAQTIDSPSTLNATERGIVLIAAFTANDDPDKLKLALGEGLDAGLTVNEIKEVLVQMYAYAGFPRSLNGINTFMAILDARKVKGIADVEGNEASPIGLFDEVEAFDPAANSWNRFEPMPLPRHSLITATFGNRIYLPGGSTARGGGPNITAYVDAFEPAQ